MIYLVVSATFFMAIHLLIAGTTVRDRLIDAFGETFYLLAFSGLSVAGIVWLVASYNHAAIEDTWLVWDFGPGVRHLGGLIMLVASLFAVMGLLTPNPTAVGGGEVLKSDDPARGMVRITRHPFLWGAAIWAGFHLVANGDAASIVFFGTFLVLSILGTVSIDSKRRRGYGEAWARFSAKTSNIPFGAIITRRNSLNLEEIGLWRLAAATAVFLAILLSHAWLFGVSPFPGGWVPF
ncbi:MAG: NnrU family protein [Alphaproteobacteria bacterium]|nr:NnrU family protein [Alphaproteobacteria bacterium]